MNLKDVRTAVFAQADWAPSQSPDAVARVNAFINRAYNQLALEAPFLFFEDEVRIATQPDVIGTDKIVVVRDLDTTDTGSRNAWVMGLGTRTTADWLQRPDGSPYEGPVWPTDRSWDGRVIEMIRSDGTIIRNRIRTIWSELDEEGDPDLYVHRLSLWTPWPVDVLGLGAVDYRIYTDHYYLPDDIIQYKSARLWKASNNWPLEVVSQDEAEQRSLVDHRTELAAGIPRELFRRKHHQITGPKVSPDVASANVQLHRWLGPEPPGEFEYRITYSWGARDIHHRNVGVGQWDENPDAWDSTLAAGASHPSRARFREPLWESAPSPVSDTIEVPSAPDNGVAPPAVELTFPNIEYMQGFMLRGDTQTGRFSRTNYARSGWHVRVYRRRKSANFENYAWIAQAGGQIVSSLHKLDDSDKFYLIADVRLDGTNEGRWIDNGTYLPDYHRPLRNVNGYHAIQFYPKPDDRYEVDVRCVRRPEALVDDTDAPRVHAEAMNVLIHAALELLYESQGDMNMANRAHARYESNLATLRKRYGDQRPPQAAVQRRLSRARPGLGGHGVRRWYTNDQS